MYQIGHTALHDALCSAWVWRRRVGCAFSCFRTRSIMRSTATLEYLNHSLRYLIPPTLLAFFAQARVRVRGQLLQLNRRAPSHASLWARLARNSCLFYHYLNPYLLQTNNEPWRCGGLPCPAARECVCCLLTESGLNDIAPRCYGRGTLNE